MEDGRRTLVDGPGGLCTLERSGFAILGPVLRESAIDRLIASVDSRIDVLIDETGSRTYGSRDLMDRVPEVRALADSPPVRSLVEPVLGLRCTVVRGIYFDKSPEANWKVPWHQDLTIAVKRRI